MGVKEHWDAVYSGRTDDQLSWTEPEPRESLELIREVCPAGGRVIDIGGGTSRLAGRLLDLRYSVTVLDVSETALARARRELGSRADQVRWIAADVTAHPDLGELFDVWHDRAVFHFLIEPAARAAYVDLLSGSLRPGGHAVIATFAPQGPQRCSGLPVRRYDGATLAVEIGPGFRLLKSIPHTHRTPRDKRQAFQYSLFERF